MTRYGTTEFKFAVAGELPDHFAGLARFDQRGVRHLVFAVPHRRLHFLCRFVVDPVRFQDAVIDQGDVRQHDFQFNLRLIDTKKNRVLAVSDTEFRKIKER